MQRHCIRSLSVKSRFVQQLLYFWEKHSACLPIRLSRYLYLCFYPSVCLNIRMYVSFRLSVCKTHVCRFYQCPHMDTHVSISFSASLYLRMYAQKPMLTAILSYLEMHIFFWVFILLISRESAQAHLRQSNKQKNHMTLCSVEWTFAVREV